MFDRVYVEQLVAGFMVRYNKLSEIIQQTYAGSNSTRLNIFVDLNSIIKPLYSRDGYSKYIYRNKLEIVASVLNLCGHYRSFFSNIGVATRFFIIYGLNAPEQQFVKGYNGKFVEEYIKKKDVTKYVITNVEMLKIITPYIPDIFFYDIGLNEVCGMIYHILSFTAQDNKNLNIESLVISKDVLMLQLISDFTNLRILRPVKRVIKENGESLDESFIVDANNLWRRYMDDYRKLKEYMPNINIGYLSNIMAMSMVKDRNIYSIYNIRRAIQLIMDAINKGYIKPDVACGQTALNEALYLLGISGHSFEIDCRYKAINPKINAEFLLLNQLPELRTLRFTNLYDPKGLKEIISSYFDNDVIIDLNRLGV